MKRKAGGETPPAVILIKKNQQNLPVLQMVARVRLELTTDRV